MKGGSVSEPREQECKKKRMTSNTRMKIAKGESAQRGQGEEELKETIWRQRGNMQTRRRGAAEDRKVQRLE